MLPSNLLVPERVTKATCTAPSAAWSAVGVAPVTVTSSTASSRGVTIEKKPSVDWKLLFTLTPS